MRLRVDTVALPAAGRRVFLHDSSFIGRLLLNQIHCTWLHWGEDSQGWSGFFPQEYRLVASIELCVCFGYSDSVMLQRLISVRLRLQFTHGLSLLLEEIVDERGQVRSSILQTSLVFSQVWVECGFLRVVEHFFSTWMSRFTAFPRLLGLISFERLLDQVSQLDNVPPGIVALEV